MQKYHLCGHPIFFCGSSSMPISVAVTCQYLAISEKCSFFFFFEMQRHSHDKQIFDLKIMKKTYTYCIKTILFTRSFISVAVTCQYLAISEKCSFFFFFEMQRHSHDKQIFDLKIMKKLILIVLKQFYLQGGSTF